MTTIIYAQEKLYADGRVIQPSDNILVDNYNKIYHLEMNTKRVTIGLSGETTDENEAVNIILKLLDDEDYRSPQSTNVTALVVVVPLHPDDRSTPVELYLYSHQQLLQLDPCQSISVGSGSPIANGVLRIGRSAAEAMLAASYSDTNTGGIIRMRDVRTGDEDKKQIDSKLIGYGRQPLWKYIGPKIPLPEVKSKPPVGGVLDPKYEAEEQAKDCLNDDCDDAIERVKDCLGRDCDDTVDKAKSSAAHNKHLRLVFDNPTGHMDTTIEDFYDEGNILIRRDKYTEVQHPINISAYLNMYNQAAALHYIMYKCGRMRKVIAGFHTNKKGEITT